MEYPFLEIEKVKEVIGDAVLVEWEPAKEDLLGGLLVRPDTQRERHYTGKVLKKGLDVSDEIEEGKRVLFEQFSGFEKFQSMDGMKRYAFVKEGACLAVLPPRVSIKCEDWVQYGEGEE
jgi:co-chaperonin GroES (HSP10)